MPEKYLPTYTDVAPRLTDRHADGNTTYASVCTGDDGRCLLEVEQYSARQMRAYYAEVLLSPDGARKLRDMLDMAIERMEKT